MSYVNVFVGRAAYRVNIPPEGACPAPAQPQSIEARRVPSGASFLYLSRLALAVARARAAAEGT